MFSLNVYFKALLAVFLFLNLVPCQVAYETAAFLQKLPLFKLPVVGYLLDEDETYNQTYDDHVSKEANRMSKYTPQLYIFHKLK